MVNVTIRRVSWEEEQETLLAIRFKVFVEEQSVPEDEEIDGLDPTCAHFLAYIDTVPIGVARVMPNGQIGRMAVLLPYRKQGVGGELLNEAVRTVLEEGRNTPFLHAQLHALDFYAEHGFIAHGDVFLDAGIEHRAMVYSK